MEYETSILRCVESHAPKSAWKTLHMLLRALVTNTEVELALQKRLCKPLSTLFTHGLFARHCRSCSGKQTHCDTRGEGA